MTNDIALFILSDTIKITDYVKIACLPQTNSSNIPPVNHTCEACGWVSLFLVFIDKLL